MKYSLTRTDPGTNDFAMHTIKSNAFRPFQLLQMVKRSYLY